MKQSEIQIGRIYSNKNNSKFRCVIDCTFPGECDKSYLFVCNVFNDNNRFTYGNPYHILLSSFARWANEDIGKCDKVGWKVI